jgi:esterase/lipase superfamily enzyme/Lon protease-like protein
MDEPDRPEAEPQEDHDETVSFARDNLMAVLPLRDKLAFPHMIVPLSVGREKSVRALEAAMKRDKHILLVAQKNAVDDPSTDDIYRVGTVSTILQLSELPDGTVNVLVEGDQRAAITGFRSNDAYLEAFTRAMPDLDADAKELEALGRTVVSQFEQYIKLNKNIAPEVLVSLNQIEEPSKLADTVASHLNLKIADKQELLEIAKVSERLERVFGHMESEIGMLQVERRIRNRVKRQMDTTQREHYLNQQLRAIQKELGEGEDISSADTAADTEYIVWYGTNRRPVDPADASKGYSAERDTVVHHGSCRVFVPSSHKIGSIGSPWWKRFLIGDDRLRLREVKSLGQENYWWAIASHLTMVSTNERHALVFVHGYNVSFEQAALRAAQIGFDLQVRGAMAFFSWPSRGRLGGYAADTASIEFSEDAITAFLVDFADRSGASTVHIIAHSMGNRGVLHAMDRIAQQARRRSKKKRFGQVILAAADVDAGVFRQRCAAYTRLAQRTTLYVTTRDLAIEASHWLYDFPRVGLMPPILVMPGIDTVNVTNVDLTRLGHGYVAEARSVLEDMHSLIARGEPPERRFGLRAANSAEGGRYWAIDA